MWTLPYILSQVSVCFAVLSLGLSYFTKNRVAILLLGISNSIFYGLQYLFLKQYTGAILNFIGIIRGIWFYLNNRLGVKPKQAVFSLVVSLALLIAAGIVTFSAWYSIFPIFATVTYTISVWQKNLKVYRWAIIPIETCGVLYNIMCMSILGIVLESLLLIFGIASIIKLYKHKETMNLTNKLKDDKKDEVIEPIIET